MTNNNNIKSVTEANRDAWDASADFHRNGDNWLKLKDSFRSPDFTTFDPTMARLLKQVNIHGKRVVQIGCNNGRETISAVRLGADYGLGIDQSSRFIAQAQELKQASGTECSFLCADVYDLPENIVESFDVCLITIGVLNWMPDLLLFFKAVESLLVSDGTVLIYETHPYLEMFDPNSEEPYLPLHSYFKSEPFISTDAITYDGNKRETATPSCWFSYTFSQILNACISAGLSILELQEYPHSNREAEYDIYTNKPNQLPLCYSLIAKKSA